MGDLCARCPDALLAAPAVSQLFTTAHSSQRQLFGEKRGSAREAEGQAGGGPVDSAWTQRSGEAVDSIGGNSDQAKRDAAKWLAVLL